MLFFALPSIIKTIIFDEFVIYEHGAIWITR
jgi:hypothetical protein